MAMSSEPPKALDRSRTPPIPSGTKPLQNQVAGHIFGRANGTVVNKIGFLQSTDGAVLKPALGPSKGDREVHFYQKLFSEGCQDRVLLDLRQFVAKFLGVWTTPEHPGVLYLKLENVTKRFQHPCLMDIKVGPITYDHEADEAKIAREKAKSPSLPQIGFQIVGIRRYDPTTDSYQTLDRKLVRAFNPETVLTKGLAMYFRADDSFDLALAHAFHRRLHSIESWFTAQSSYCFIASSLLFIYDGEAVRLRPGDVAEVPDGLPSQPLFTSADNGTSANCLLGCEATEESDLWWETRADLKMIDFTHAFEVSARDENYLTGLRSIIDYMSLLKPGMYKPDP